MYVHYLTHCWWRLSDYVLTISPSIQLPKLDPEDVKRINALDRGQRLCNAANERGKVWGWSYEQLGW